MTTIANYYKQLQESMKLQVKRDTPCNIKTRLIHACGDKLSFFQKSSRTCGIVCYDIDYDEKVSRRKLKNLGSLLKVQLKNSP